MCVGTGGAALPQPPPRFQEPGRGSWTGHRLLRPVGGLVPRVGPQAWVLAGRPCGTCSAGPEQSSSAERVWAGWFRGPATRPGSGQRGLGALGWVLSPTSLPTGPGHPHFPPRLCRLWPCPGMAPRAPWAGAAGERPQVPALLLPLLSQSPRHPANGWCGGVACPLSSDVALGPAAPPPTPHIVTCASDGGPGCASWALWQHGLEFGTQPGLGQRSGSPKAQTQPQLNPDLWPGSPGASGCSVCPRASGSGVPGALGWASSEQSAVCTSGCADWGT